MNDPAPQGDLASVWSALRRRKVVQWGLAYLAGAWALLQAVIDGEIVALDAHGSAGLRP